MTQPDCPYQGRLAPQSYLLDDHMVQPTSHVKDMVSVVIFNSADVRLVASLTMPAASQKALYQYLCIMQAA